MVAFLLTIGVISALVCTGYRLNLYLYTRGAMGATSHPIQPIVAEFHARAVREGEMGERDYGLRYARTGLLFIGVCLALLVLGLIIAIIVII